jgi:hypothetical protein
MGWELINILREGAAYRLILRQADPSGTDESRPEWVSELISAIESQRDSVNPASLISRTK